LASTHVGAVKMGNWMRNRALRDFLMSDSTGSFRIASMVTGIEICKALGLDPAVTASVVIEVRPGALPLVTVTQNLPDQKVFTAVLRRFHLMEIPPD
jgi:hypothetical protein